MNSELLSENASNLGSNGSRDTKLKLKGIQKIFYTDEIETRALDNIDLSIGGGEFLSISGPSGCGKTTLLSIIGLLDTPTSGSYLINNQEALGMNANLRAKLRNREIGFIFQSFNLIGEMTVYENVELPLVYAGVPVSERRAMVRDSLSKVNMEHRETHYPSQLSGGQQQRVAVARALVGNPTVLLADEPTGNLDSKNGNAVMDLLCRLNAEGATICMVTHDERYNAYAKRVIHLLDGRIVEDVNQ